jgi:hypothetical protein
MVASLVHYMNYVFKKEKDIDIYLCRIVGYSETYV